jgi:hypothetical protein
MSCLAFMSPAQRAALAASTSAGLPLSAFTSPPATPGKLRRLRTLAESSQPRIRESAALSVHAPVDLLVLLDRDRVASVRACVARNERVPSRLLRRLASDPETPVRAWVAAHRSTPDDVRRILARDPDPAVRAVLAWAVGWSRPTREAP